jgi:hypothetical protein
VTRVARQLAAAIQTMRDACDQAERTATLADARAARRVLHELTWGLANASSSIEGALNALEDECAVALAQTEKDAEPLHTYVNAAHWWADASDAELEEQNDTREKARQRMVAAEAGLLRAGFAFASA